MSEKTRWGILSTARIANRFADAINNSERCELVAVASRSVESAEEFGSRHSIPRRYSSYEELLADDTVQVVYVSTPHPMHAEWAIKAMDAGKHVLCEKPLTLNHPQAMAVVEAAIRNDVFLMEGFIYRCLPQTRKVVDLIRQGEIGDVRLIEAQFGIHTPYDLNDRYLNHELGGGGILDVGCYPVSFVRLIAGAALGKDFADPVEVKASGYIGDESRVDEYTAAILCFPGDVIAQVSTSVQVAVDNIIRIYGSKGQIHIPQPTMPGRDTGEASIVLKRDGQESRQIDTSPGANPYVLEVETVVDTLSNRQARPPAMTWEDSLGNMKTLDMWRAAIGLEYDMEKPERQTIPVSGRPLSVREPNEMQYGTIEGVGKKISRLVMGADNQANIAHATVMFDDFFERGGNCFDTAYIYGGGRNERILGQWIKNRGLRDQVVILDKGAHTPHCDPESINKQLLESLERLQTDYVDIYVLHRDNPDIPVGEFVDVLNEHQRAGRIRVFGGSNWSISRIEEANQYAKSNGLSPFSILSNNFSLARMVDPVWAGCISASDQESRAWLQRTQMPLMPWSSQARGFFTDRAGRDKRSDPELVRCWYSEDNFQRRERVLEMARQRGVLPINIALAYVLCQPFPTFALIGPRLLSETRTSFPGLKVNLSPEDLRWLNLETD